MNTINLTEVALRQRALFFDVRREEIDMNSESTAAVMAFIARLKENGYCVSEELLHALNNVSPVRLAEITKVINKVLRVGLNWAPLVKGWNVPRGERLSDHIITLIVNLLGKDSDIKGTTLPCGHLIPEGTFPIERYNGCPFCGTPFKTADFVYRGQGSKLKELRLFTKSDMEHLFETLLSSPVPLDATQQDSLSMLLAEFPLPETPSVTMKETVMLVVKRLVELGRDGEAGKLLKTPTDILRYQWYEKTGYIQLIEPKTLIAHASRLYTHIWGPLDKSADAAKAMKEKLMLKYDRRTCRRVARWLNALPMTPEAASETMNPKRGMWVRMIRALRLGEFSRKEGFGNLSRLLDVFYNRAYSTWQGHVDKAKSENDSSTTLSLLKERPGLFARCLFASMLRFGSDHVLAAFNEVTDKLPARLLLSLGNAADTYFDPSATRIARPITGVAKTIDSNPLLTLYNKEILKEMAAAVNDLYRDSMARRFAAHPTETKTIYIDPLLYNIPVGVGDRTTTIQDTSCALMGTRFPVEGDAVRLFMQWGKGLHAQHLDMDPSCRISFADGRIEECAYYNLTCTGAKHSGDIISIPEMVGTAEYIELSIPELESAKAKYAVFTCNAYSTGSLSPNLMVGWMDSQNEMKLSNETGVAYDPSCVQHIVRISESNLSKGLVFGVLDVAKREIIWLEMPFTSQTLRGADSRSIEALLRKVTEKLSIGELLEIKAKSQGLTIVENADDADETYTYAWALNPAEVAALLNS